MLFNKDFGAGEDKQGKVVKALPGGGVHALP